MLRKYRTKQGKQMIFAFVLAAMLISQISTFNCAYAQVAGLNTLSMLKLPSAPRTAALGANYLSVWSPTDLNVGLDNPSLISTQYDNRLVLNYTGFFAGSNAGTVAYGRDFHRFGSFLFGLQFNSYGHFDAYDENEQEEGTFYASDVAAYVGWGLNIDSCFSIGVSFRPVWSQYESYTAFAFALNVAGSYVSSDKRFAATIQARNIGTQIATFNGTSERLPFDLSASMSYKASNAPFRLYFAMDQLTRWDLSYRDPLSPTVQFDPYTGEELAKPWYDGIATALDLIARHCAVGIEAEIKKVLFLQLGYRFRQTAEMGADDRTNINLSGFSYGFGLHTKKFDFSFARRNYHLGQAPNYLSLSFKF